MTEEIPEIGKNLQIEVEDLLQEPQPEEVQADEVVIEPPSEEPDKHKKYLQ